MQEKVDHLENDNAQFVEKLKLAGEQNEVKNLEIEEFKKQVELLQNDKTEQKNASECQKKYEKLKVSKTLPEVGIGIRKIPTLSANPGLKFSISQFDDGLLVLNF